MHNTGSTRYTTTAFTITKIFLYQIVAVVVGEGGGGAEAVVGGIKLFWYFF